MRSGAGQRLLTLTLPSPPQFGHFLYPVLPPVFLVRFLILIVCRAIVQALIIDISIVADVVIIAAVIVLLNLD